MHSECKLEVPVFIRLARKATGKTLLLSNEVFDGAPERIKLGTVELKSYCFETERLFLGQSGHWAMQLRTTEIRR